MLLALGAIWPAVAIAVIYLGMLGVRLAIPPGRLRLGLLAALMLLIAAVALISVTVLAVSAG